MAEIREYAKWRASDSTIFTECYSGRVYLDGKLIAYDFEDFWEQCEYQNVLPIERVTD